jgi:hypothetical protein
MDTEYKVRVGVIPRAAHSHRGVPGGTAPTRCMRDAYAANQTTPTPPRENISWCAPSKSSNNGRETLGKESNGKTMNNEPRPGTTVVVPSRYHTVCMYVCTVLYIHTYIHTSHGFAVRHACCGSLGLHSERMRIRRSDCRGSVNHRTPTNHAKSQAENLICWGHRRCTSLGLSSSSCVARRLVAYKDELMWWDPSRSPYQDQVLTLNPPRWQH